MNVVQTVIDRQLGIYTRVNYDAALRRLAVAPAESFHGLSNAGPGALSGPALGGEDPPMFACRFAEQPQHAHVLALANEDGRVAIQDTSVVRANSTLEGFQCHNNAVFDLAWRPGHMNFVTVSGDHTASLWDIESGAWRRLLAFSSHSRSVKTCVFRRDQPQLFATGARDGHILLWDIRAPPAPQAVLYKPDNSLMNCHAAFTPKTPGSHSKRARLDNVRATSITGLVFQDDQTLISCGECDGNIKVWDLRKNYNVYKREPLPKHSIPYCGSSTKNGYTNLIIDEASRRLYASCMDNVIYCFNISTYNTVPEQRYIGHENSTFYIKTSLSPDSKYLVSGSSDKNAYIWNVKYSQPVVRLAGHWAEVTCAAWCPRGDTKVVTCSDDARHKIWRIGKEYLDRDEEMELKGRAELVPHTEIASLPQWGALDGTPKSLKRKINLTPSSYSAKRAKAQDTAARKSKRCLADMMGLCRDADEPAVARDRADGLSVARDRADGLSVARDRADGLSVARDRADGLSVARDRADGLSVARDRAGGLSVARDRADGLSVARDRADGLSVARDRADGLSVARDRADGLSVARDRADGLSVARDRADGLSVARDRADGLSVARDRADGLSVARDRADGLSVARDRADGLSVARDRADGLSVARDRADGLSVARDRADGLSVARDRADGLSVARDRADGLSVARDRADGLSVARDRADGLSVARDRADGLSVARDRADGLSVARDRADGLSVARDRADGLSVARDRADGLSVARDRADGLSVARDRADGLSVARDRADGLSVARDRADGLSVARDRADGLSVARDRADGLSVARDRADGLSVARDRADGLSVARHEGTEPLHTTPTKIARLDTDACRSHTDFTYFLPKPGPSFASPTKTEWTAKTPVSRSSKDGCTPVRVSPEAPKVRIITIKTPTKNLPNFVLNGEAPHLRLMSPAKKRPRADTTDWLTALRLARPVAPPPPPSLDDPPPPPPPPRRSSTIDKQKSGHKTRTLLKYFNVSAKEK